MNYGYIRCSTNKQEEASQQLALFQYGLQNNIPIDKVVSETISSRKKLEERELYDLINNLNKGDRLLITEVSRLGRSIMEIYEIINILLKKEVEVIITSTNKVVNEDMDTQAMIFAFGLAAQAERELISQRTKIGLQNAVAHGKKIGRPKGATSKSKLDPHLEEIKNLLDKRVSKASICKIYSVSFPTLQNFIKTRIEKTKKQK